MALSLKLSIAAEFYRCEVTHQSISQKYTQRDRACWEDFNGEHALHERLYTYPLYNCTGADRYGHC